MKYYNCEHKFNVHNYHLSMMTLQSAWLGAGKFDIISLSE